MINRRRKFRSKRQNPGGFHRTRRGNLTRVPSAQSSGKRGARSRSERGAAGPIRYAVVGLGHIAQTAVLPAFAHARNSKLTALVSDDPIKLRKLQKQYDVPQTASYDQYDALLAGGEIDAVFIAEPNSLHRQFAVRAAEAGVHVLCEKPLAVTEEECEQMIQAARRNRVKLMTAYRLHFERANLEAIELARSGKLGEPRFFNSIFSMQAKEGNIRLQKKLGGGPLYDLGVYCINASRYLFQAEPIEVIAFTANNGERRFREVEEMTGALLRFPGDRLASFICSFGAADTGNYDLVGTKGSLRLKGAYEYAMPIEWELTIGDKVQSRTFSKRDQFAPELVYFSDCILKGKEPEPSGLEGANDVRIIEALHESARKGVPVRLRNPGKTKRPGLKQEIRRPPIDEPDQVRAQNPSKD